MTPREAVYDWVRSQLSDQVGESGPGWTPADVARNTRLRATLPGFHDNWTAEFTDGLFAILEKSNSPTRAMVEKYVRDGLLEPFFDDATPEEIARDKVEVARHNRKWTDGICSALASAGYEVRS